MEFIKGDYTIVPNVRLLLAQPPVVLSIYFWLCVHANEGGQCWPARQKLSEEASVSLKTVDNSLKKLVDLGVLEKDPRVKENKTLSNMYTILIKNPEVGAYQVRGGAYLVPPGGVPRTHRTKYSELNKGNYIRTSARGEETDFTSSEALTPPSDCAPPPPTKRFSPPAVEEVALYCQERKNKIDPQQFCDSYASKGWMVGRSPMKDWKAAVRTWERNGINRSDTKTLRPTFPEL